MAKHRHKKGFMEKHWKTVAYILGVVTLALWIWKMFFGEERVVYGNVMLSDSEVSSEKPELIVDLLTVNPYSRAGKELEEVNNIVIHYTANPGSSAQNNRDYFEGLKDSKNRSASSHFVVGLDGEIIQCIPTWEVAYASNERNKDTIAIECCHPDETGAFTKNTYQSMVQLTAWLCKKFNLTEEDVIRHYDVTGKNCPKYFVENEEEWVAFKGYIQQALDEE